MRCAAPPRVPARSAADGSVISLAHSAGLSWPLPDEVDALAPGSAAAQLLRVLGEPLTDLDQRGRRTGADRNARSAFRRNRLQWIRKPLSESCFHVARGKAGPGLADRQCARGVHGHASNAPFARSGAAGSPFRPRATPV